MNFSMARTCKSLRISLAQRLSRPLPTTQAHHQQTNLSTEGTQTTSLLSAGPLLWPSRRTAQLRSSRLEKRLQTLWLRLAQPSLLRPWFLPLRLIARRRLQEWSWRILMTTTHAWLASISSSSNRPSCLTLTQRCSLSQRELTQV